MAITLRTKSLIERALDGKSIDELASLGYVPPNVPLYGEPGDDDVVNTNPVVDRELQDRIEDDSENDDRLTNLGHIPDALYVEHAVRMIVRRMIETK